jgi:GAF domain-containing protein
MAEELIITAKTKEGKYKELLPQIKALVEEETDLIANLANISAALKESLHFFWVGFYLVKENQLVLGPFQGPVACTRINKGKGVCGTVWQKGETILVPDVMKFPKHIACSALSKSEIVIPLFNKSKQVIGVFDVDSDQLNSFDQIDEKYLTEIISYIPQES